MTTRAPIVTSSRSELPAPGEGIVSVSSGAKSDQHMPQLDSLRAFAVFVVLIEHYIPGSDPVRKYIPFGTFGVRLFFVLSGYLITGILFRCRARLESGEQRLGSTLKSFFARRFIRLMPVYYVYLAAIAIAMPFSRQYIWAFALYLQNFLFAAQPDVFAKLLAHFWSLAVEEQFYVTWPLVVLLVPRRQLVPTLAAFVVAGPVTRAAGLLLGYLPLQIDMMMPSHFDTLALGGVLAVLQSGTQSERAQGARLTSWGLRLGAPLTIASVVALDQGMVELWTLLAELAMGLLFVWVVSRAASGFGGTTGKVLEANVLQNLGKVSYGIYVYHFNVPWLLRELAAPRLGFTLPDGVWARFPIFAIVTVAIAAGSWHLMERPINRLKNRFPYTVPRTQATMVGAAGLKADR